MSRRLAHHYVAARPSPWRQDRHAVSKPSWRVVHIGGRRQPGLIVEVGEQALRKALQSGGRREAGRSLSDRNRGGVGNGRRQPRDEPRLRYRPLEPLPHEVGLPSRQLDEPLEGGPPSGWPDRRSGEHRREITVLGSRSATPHHLDAAAKLLPELQLPSPAVYPLAEFERGLDAYTRGEALKVVFTP